ncbi:heart- and neural crest derivatives-expressed protein 2-like [Dreissena polymorpha]|uniref:BHLH domain-containing protein n=1 Tax=Dreissena polymorpha TaxID=45954 RepID=A0A9D4QST8_DREPO|nr:heart- and neural crest derivatives-expressed protein 2-like [Dreissena polymorpha]XP_052278928.1 heart- and neural crest derivatives-expressed protein 2-like [Dreissena polymorpha]KAH3842144.1 hypothetical protein DPMN_115638 [Dreissena polymorpha]KAH3843982.1 hypothetical protein DPMN_117517 [Dreissena polymorpha]
MSISVGGYHGGFAHPTSMGITSGQDYFTAAHYPSTSVYPEYPFTDRDYFNNWVLNGTTDIPMSPEPYGAACGTPSPPMMGVVHHGYADGMHQTFAGWSDFPMNTAELALAHNIPISEIGNYESYTNAFGDRCLRRRTSANRKERRRTLSINNAFSNLRCSIPNVPSDTKLSKIKTLRLAISYISYLTEILEKGDSNMVPNSFKADISRKRERRSLPVEDEKKIADSCESDDSSESSTSHSSSSEPKVKGRTGWPEAVWASELRGNSPPEKPEASSLS